MIIFNSFVAGLCFCAAAYEAIHYKPGRGGWMMLDVVMCLLNLFCALAEYMA